MLPDAAKKAAKRARKGLNAPTGAWCSLTRKEPHGRGYRVRLNAPTGAWCSLTMTQIELYMTLRESQCTYRCVVLPDFPANTPGTLIVTVSMHLQVRSAP